MTSTTILYRADLYPSLFPLIEEETILPGNEYYIYYHEFDVTKTTSKGAWISAWGKKKFILLSARKKFACTSKEEALYALLRRKQIHQKRLQETLDTVTYELKALESLNIQKP